MPIRPRTVIALCAVACGGGGATSPDASGNDFDRQALLANLATRVIVPSLERFDAASDALVVATAAACDGAAQAAWRTAMTAWQEAALVRVGPTDASTLRDRIYSWPVVSSCAVDGEVMTRWQNPGVHDLGGKLTNRRGLPALEYLLFAPSLETTCAAAPAGWSALSDADRRAARCDYARAAAVDLAAQAQALLDGWRPGYAEVMVNAGASGSPFRSAQEGVNRISDGFFALDTEVKDMKLGEPAGIALGSCGTLGAPCPQDLESPWSAHSKENILANLRGFQALFLGSLGELGGMGAEGTGFDDFLAALHAPALAATMEADITAAIAAAEAIPGSLGEAITAAPDRVAAAHARVKRLTDALKSQFLTALALELPEDLGDDGD